MGARPEPRTSPQRRYAPQKLRPPSLRRLAAQPPRLRRTRPPQSHLPAWPLGAHPEPRTPPQRALRASKAQTPSLRRLTAQPPRLRRTRPPQSQLPAWPLGAHPEPQASPQRRATRATQLRRLRSGVSARAAPLGRPPQALDDAPRASGALAMPGDAPPDAWRRAPGRLAAGPWVPGDALLGAFCAPTQPDSPVPARPSGAENKALVRTGSWPRTMIACRAFSARYGTSPVRPRRRPGCGGTGRS
ncbi:Basic proline-rich protein precursor [[Actinomadura] parvosata subsp. kistnae]|nr:Basic proline-rich protein precursor [Actinomadura parvosata subsp. kistnae]